MSRLDKILSTDTGRQQRRRVGRGLGSGIGKTGGRGSKGEGSRTGGKNRGPMFEGGQFPFWMRLPKRGFTNIFKKQWIEVSLTSLDSRFEANEEITPELMHERGVIAKGRRDVVVLGTGEVSKALRVAAHRFTKSAREKIERAGGAVTLIEKSPVADPPQP